MERKITTVTEQFAMPALELVEQVFTAHENAAEGRLVRRLVEEIRAGKYYLPEMEWIMTDETDEIIGYAMFSRFHLEGKYDRELLLLSPVAVKTALQRQHISKQLIEHGFEKARALGYKAVLVEGDPRNYRARGFETAARYGIVAGPNIHLPHIDCLMVKELIPGGLKDIHGVVDYGMYPSLTTGE
ncbi:MAG: N-acetyltransferase [Clostridia bacterium]|nr:N-acetyltransferase [Clostridia bacterium]